jgi:hypothetical protein
VVFKEAVESGTWNFVTKKEDIKWEEMWLPIEKVSYALRIKGEGENGNQEEVVCVCVDGRYIILKISFEKWLKLVEKDR